MSSWDLHNLALLRYACDTHLVNNVSKSQLMMLLQASRDLSIHCSCAKVVNDEIVTLYCASGYVGKIGKIILKNEHDIMYSGRGKIFDPTLEPSFIEELIRRERKADKREYVRPITSSDESVFTFTEAKIDYKTIKDYLDKLEKSNAIKKLLDKEYFYNSDLTLDYYGLLGEKTNKQP